MMPIEMIPVGCPVIAPVGEQTVAAERNTLRRRGRSPAPRRHATALEEEAVEVPQAENEEDHEGEVEADDEAESVEHLLQGGLPRGAQLESSRVDALDAHHRHIRWHSMHVLTLRFADDDFEMKYRHAEFSRRDNQEILAWGINSVLLCLHTLWTLRLLSMLIFLVSLAGVCTRIYFQRLPPTARRLQGYTRAVFALALCSLAALIAFSLHDAGSLDAASSLRTTAAGAVEPDADGATVVTHVVCWISLTVALWSNRAHSKTRARNASRLPPRAPHASPRPLYSHRPCPRSHALPSTAAADWSARALLTLLTHLSMMVSGVPSPKLPMDVSVLACLVGTAVGWCVAHALESRSREAFLQEKVSHETMLIWREVAWTAVRAQQQRRRQ